MKSDEKKRGRKFFRILLVVLILAVVNEVMNRSVMISNHELVSDKLPGEFNGYKILQITDLHSIRKKEQADMLIEKIQKEEPDMIAITGDLLDSTYYTEEREEEWSTTGEPAKTAGEDTLNFVKEMLHIAPVYLVYGNHEMILLDDPLRNPFKVALEDMGVVFMNNKAMEIVKNGESITLLGIQDPATLYKDEKYAYIEGGSKERICAMLEDVWEQAEKGRYTILLSHRPEFFDTYKEYPIDLVLTGHAHGGQFRIPFLGGLYAPAQGWFPKYTAGVYKSGSFSMVVGRGIGNSLVPMRVLNPPEIVVITLEREF